MLPLVVQIERSRGEPTVTRVFHQSPVHIGQSPHATLRLCEPHIAEWQASIHFDAERAVYRDLAARDARPADIEPHTPLEVELGRVRLRIQRRALLDDLTLDAPADPPTLVAPPQLTQPNPVFITTHRVVGATEHAERAAGTAHLLAYPAGAEHKPSARLMTGQQSPPYVVTPRRGIAERARAQTDPAREHEPSRSSEHACTAQAAACAPTSLVAVSHPRVIREACTVGGAPPTNARGTGPGPHPHDDPGWVDDTSPPSGPRAGTQRAAARRLAASEAAGPIDPTAAARHGTQWATPLQHAGHAPSWGEVGWAACASGTDERDVSRDQHAGTSWERAAAQQSGEVAWAHGASGCARSDAWDGGPLHARDERVARVSVAPERVIDRARWEDAMRREDRDKERPYAPIQGPTSFAHEQRARGLGAVPELAPRERVVAPLHPSCVRSAEDWPRADESLDLPPLTAAEAAAGSAGRRFADPLAAAEWQLEQARAAWLLQVQRALDGAPAWSRAERIRALHANNPRLIEEAQFRHWAERCGVDPRELGHIELGTWLSRVCGVQSGPVPPSQWAPMLEQVGRVLELFSRAFVDAQRAQRRVREQLGLAATRRPEPANVLTRATESHAVIAYLLEPRRDPERRSHELQHQLADLAMHQVGILSGVLEGARALIHQLAPAQFSGGDSTRGAGNDAKLRETLNPFTAHKAWRRFSLRHQALLEPEQLGRELFGREFAQRYNVVTGNTPPSPAPQAVIHPPLIHPRPRSTPPPPPPRRKARTHI